MPENNFFSIIERLYNIYIHEKISVKYRDVDISQLIKKTIIYKILTLDEYCPVY